MIGTLIRHLVLDTGLSCMFDGLISNFHISQKPTHYLGDWWTVQDKDDDTIVCWGRCIQEEGNLIVIDDGDGEYIIHTDLYQVSIASEEECDLLSDDSIDEDTIIEYLNKINDNRNMNKIENNK